MLYGFLLIQAAEPILHHIRGNLSAKESRFLVVLSLHFAELFVFLLPLLSCFLQLFEALSYSLFVVLRELLKTEHNIC